MNCPFVVLIAMYDILCIYIYTILIMLDIGWFHLVTMGLAHIADMTIAYHNGEKTMPCHVIVCHVNSIKW